jgi:hypothetical protein
MCFCKEFISLGQKSTIIFDKQVGNQRVLNFHFCFPNVYAE